MNETPRPNFSVDFLRGMIPFVAPLAMFKENMGAIERMAWAGLFTAVEIATWVVPALGVVDKGTPDLEIFMYLALGKGAQGVIFAVARGTIYNDNHPNSGQ